MKLTFKETFEIELENGAVIGGTFRDLTKKERKEIEIKFEKDQQLANKLQKLSKKAKRLSIELKYEDDKSKIKEIQKKIFKIEDEAETLQKELESLNTREETSKIRFNMCVKSDKIGELLEICEQYSYEIVMQTILKDIEEKKQNATQN